MKILDITDMVKNPNVSFNDIKKHIITEARKPEVSPLVGKNVVVNAGRYVNAKGTIVKLVNGMNAINVKFEDNSIATIFASDFEIVS